MAAHCTVHMWLKWIRHRMRIRVRQNDANPTGSDIGCAQSVTSCREKDQRGCRILYCRLQRSVRSEFVHKGTHSLMTEGNCSYTMLRIRIRRIHTFLGLPDPDPLERGTDGSGYFYHKAKIVRKTLIPTL